jgi:methyl-accepting chemotaxis protein
MACALTAVPPAGAVAATSAFAVDGNVGLQSFVSLTDAHVRATLDALTVFSETAAARSGSWPAIEAAFPAAMRGNVPATYLYAAPNGRYWVVGKGLQSVTVSDRPYFKRAVSGKDAVGDILLSRSVGNVVGVVAVPVRDASGKIVGVLGAGIDLAKLTAILAKELGIGSSAVFWAIDANGITALHSDPANIFNDALKVPELEAVLRHMIATDAGTQTYAFKGKTRTVLYRHSTLTGWTYGFGVLH